MLKKTDRIADLLKEKQQRQEKSLAILLDPDKVDLIALPAFLEEANRYQVDCFFIGGSLITHYRIDEITDAIRKHTNIPVVLFPGSSLHISPSADAILLLSLISGRNPDLLIGQHVTAAPLIKQSKLEVIPTGYMLIESGRPTTVSYISNTSPIPSDKPDIAACTAMAGEMLGLRTIFMDAGSGALRPISSEMIRKVRQHISIPLIIGGGIDTAEKAYLALEAGADLIVIGNAFEKNPQLLPEIALQLQHFKVHHPINQ